MKDEKKNSLGRPTKYDPRFDHMAEVACRTHGFSDGQLAELFGVCIATITNWKSEYSTFLASVKRGKEQFDTALVEQTLLKRATGYTTIETIHELVGPKMTPVKRLEKQVALI